MEPIVIKGANKLPARDLRAIAYFFRIIKNYEKMLSIEKSNSKKTRNG